jgi:hypothetical protein
MKASAGICTKERADFRGGAKPIRKRGKKFFVSGTSKAQVVKEVIDEPRDPMRLPAQFVQPALHGGSLYWLLDREAAGEAA